MMVPNAEGPPGFSYVWSGFSPVLNIWQCRPHLTRPGRQPDDRPRAEERACGYSRLVCMSHLSCSISSSGSASPSQKRGEPCGAGRPQPQSHSEGGNEQIRERAAVAREELPPVWPSDCRPALANVPIWRPSRLLHNSSTSLILCSRHGRNSRSSEHRELSCLWGPPNAMRYTPFNTGSRGADSTASVFCRCATMREGANLNGTSREPEQP